LNIRTSKEEKDCFLNEPKEELLIYVTNRLFFPIDLEFFIQKEKYLCLIDAALISWLALKSPVAS
jgi:hypothetical protein